MAQCVPSRLDRLVSPDPLNGIGHIVLTDRQSPLPIRLGDVQVTSGKDGFQAELVVVHGDRVRAELQFTSDPDGCLTMREKLVALADLTTARIATGQIGILNNPGWIYENGRRTVAINGQEQVVPALSGKRFGAQGVQQLSIDGVLCIRGTQPLRPQYVGARQPNRARATDLLYLNYVDRKQSWRAGETISEYEAVVHVEPDPSS